MRPVLPVTQRADLTDQLMRDLERVPDGIGVSAIELDSDHKRRRPGRDADDTGGEQDAVLSEPGPHLLDDATALLETPSLLTPAA